VAVELLDKLMSYKYRVITKCSLGDTDVNELSVILLVMATKA
jgi:hypothetical protein